MNVERLYEVVVFLHDQDAKLGIQERLNELRNSLSALANQPQNQGHQSQVAQGISALESVLMNFESAVTPAQRALIASIGGSEFFSVAMVENIKSQIAQNAITPTVVSSAVNELTSRRQNYLNNLEKGQQGLTGLGVRPQSPEADAAELGVLIPRNLFGNHLGPFSQELSVINRIIRLFEEVTTGATQPVEVYELSSSEPTIFLGMPVAAALAIAKAVDWLIEKWKAIEEIRKVRAETKKLGVESALKSFDDKIAGIVKESIEDFTKDLINKYQGDTGRRHELEVGIEWSMKSLLARVERGLSIEVRPIEAPKDIVDSESASQREALYAELNQVGRKLQFQEVNGPPILELPGPEPPSAS